MTTKHKRSIGGTGLLVLAALFLALTVLNGVLFRGVQLDLTENHLYTISEGTEHILQKIQEPVNLYFFYSDKATRNIPYLRTYAQRVRELLQELVLKSDGKLRLAEIDPLPFSEEEDRASQFGLQAVSLGSGDPIYFGLAGTNAVDDLEIISFFQPDRESFLEYDLAKMIYTLSNPEKPVVAVLSTLPITGGFDPATGRSRQPWVISTQVEQLFEVRNLDSAATTIDDDVDLLVLVHPRLLTDQTLYAIDQFVMRGGKLIVFVDPLSDAQLPQDFAGASTALFEDRSSTLEPLFDAWGIRFDPDEVVLDQANALTVNTGNGQPPVRHLAILGIGPKGLSASDVITADLTSVNLGSAGHLGVTDDAADGLQMIPLVSSSDVAGLVSTETLKFLPDPGTLQDDFAPTGETYVLAARFTGQLPSAFPEGPPSSGDETAPAGEHLSSTADMANVIVVADTDVLTDRMWVRADNVLGQRLFTAFAGNGAMVVNALDNLLGSTDLISVRSRGTFARPFDKVEALQAAADASYREQEQALQRELEDTERRLTALESAKDQDNLLIISPEQQAELERFQQEKLRIRKELRDVRRNLDKSIEDLGTTLKLINIALVPLLLSVAAIVMAIVRLRRRG